MVYLRRLTIFSLSLGLIVGQIQTAGAQAVRSERSKPYWATNLSITSMLIAGGLSASLIRSNPMRDAFWFGPDHRVTEHYSETAASISDVLFLTEVAGPVIYLGIEAGTSEFANAGLVYAQAHAVNFAFTSLVKYSVRRPRPFTYRLLESEDELHDCDSIFDHCLSFFSGHSSVAFTSALSGGYLINETLSPSVGYRALNWALLMTGAAATAHLRVRAGKHFYSDVVVGTLIGSGIGIGIPLAHGGEYRPAPIEYGAALGGLTLGAALPLLLPTTDEFPGAGTLTPYVVPGHGAGLRATGSW